jgi:vitamin B12 transporter
MRKWTLLALLISPLISANTILPEIVVTATLTPQSIDNTLAATTVITRQEIQHSQAMDLPSLLRGRAGIDITSNGGPGQASSLFMRGSESDHTLILLDGIRISSATLGTAALQHLPLAQIERIEIVRGPRSSLYGSEAIGGVIQIFTRRASLGKPEINLQLGTGSNSHYNTSIYAGHKLANSWLNITANYEQTKGFDACRDSLISGCYAVEPDEDGYKNRGLNINAGYKFNPNNQLSLQAMRNQGQVEFDSSFGGNEMDFSEQIIKLEFDSVLNDFWLSTVNFARFNSKQDTFGNASSSHFDTERDQFSWHNELNYSQQTLNFGYDRYNDKVDSDTAYTELKRYNQGLFIQYQQTGDFSSIIALRIDDNQQFGRHTTGNLNLGYAISPQLRLLAAAGRAFKAPSFNELYYPNFGNPNLVPEKANSYELGLSGKNTNYHWQISAYRTDIDNLIATNYDANTQSFFADNVDKAKINGIEAEFKFKIANWQLDSQFNWLKPQDKITGHDLPRRARKSARINLSQQIQQTRLGIEWLVQSSRFDDKANKIRLSGYGIVNLTAQYEMQNNWQLQLKFGNVFNRQYELVHHYNTADRNVFLNLNYQF